MRVVLLALQVREPMGQYVEALAAGLTAHADVHLLVPEHYDRPVGRLCLHTFATGPNRGRAMLRMLQPIPAYRIWREVRALRPHAVHLLNGEGSPWSVLWASLARRDGIPLGITVHDPEPHPFDPLEAVHGRLARFAWAQAAWLHVHSARFIPILEQQGIRRDRMVVIPHGSLARRFLPWRVPGVPRESLALFFGRLTAYKGLDTLVEAGVRLAGSPRVAIAGPGHLDGGLRRRMRAHPSWFELHTRHLSEPEVARLFQRASVLVMPYKHATQSSLPLIAAGFGVPVVATSVGGLIEDVQRVNGTLVPPADPAALAAGIRETVGRVPRYPEGLEFEQIASAFVAHYARFCEPEVAISPLGGSSRGRSGAAR